MTSHFWFYFINIRLIPEYSTFGAFLLHELSNRHFLQALYTTVQTYIYLYATDYEISKKSITDTHNYIAQQSTAQLAAQTNPFYGVEN